MTINPENIRSLGITLGCCIALCATAIVISIATAEGRPMSPLQAKLVWLAHEAETMDWSN